MVVIQIIISRRYQYIAIFLYIVNDSTKKKKKKKGGKKEKKKVTHGNIQRKAKHSLI